MKKKIFIILFCILLIVIGGNHLKNEINKKNIMQEESPRIKKFLQYNYPDIKNIAFTKVVIHPTGVPHIEGYVNENKNYFFSASVSSPHFNTGVSFSAEWHPESMGTLSVKTFNEIEAEEKK